MSRFLRGRVQTNHARRGGFTLLQLMLVISVSFFLLLITIAWISKTMQFSTKIRMNRRQHIHLTQLARVFRQDVRNSNAMRLERDKLVLDQFQRVVEFEIDEETLTRKVLSSTGGMESQERFQLSNQCVLIWDDRELPETVTLLVYRNNPEFEVISRSGDDSQSNRRLSRDDLITFPLDMKLTATMQRWPESVQVVYPATSRDNASGPEETSKAIETDARKEPSPKATEDQSEQTGAKTIESAEATVEVAEKAEPAQIKSSSDRKDRP